MAALPLALHPDRLFPADPATRTCDHDNLAFHHACHGHSPCVAFSTARLTAAFASRNFSPE